MGMKPGMKMLAMAKTQGGRMGGYDQEMTDRPEMRRRRDDRGRYMEGDDRTRMGGYDREMRRLPEDPMGRRMDERGGADMRYNPHDERDNPYDGDPREREDRRPDKMATTYGGNIRYERPDGAQGNISYFKAKGDHAGHEDKMMGFQQRGDMGDRGFDKETAMEWVEHMEDKDGVKGGMYSWHQTQQYGRNLGIIGEERLVEFYAVMNAMYSDFHAVGKKFGVDKPEFYAHLAKCWIEDPDAVEDKTQMYYECIAKHK